MADFHQNGVVTVLHRLEHPNIEQLEIEIEPHASENPIALVLPSLYAKLERPALKGIVETLKHVRYLNKIMTSLDRASALEFRLAKQYFLRPPPARPDHLEQRGPYPGDPQAAGLPRDRHRPAGQRARLLDPLWLCVGPAAEQGDRLARLRHS